MSSGSSTGRWVALAAGALAAGALAAYLLMPAADPADGAAGSADADADDAPPAAAAAAEEEEEGERLRVLTTVAPAARGKKKRTTTKMKRGFLNGLDGLDSPRKSSSPPPPAADAPRRRALEDAAIAEFIEVSRRMHELAAAAAGPAAAAASSSAELEALQRHRMALVAGLQQLGGDAAVARLEAALADVSPPPPPPEPAELYRQSIAHRIMVDPKFKIEKKEPTGLEREVQTTVRRAYWDSIRGRLASEGDAGVADVVGSLVKQVCAAIIDIREDSPKFRLAMAKQLQDAIDLEFLTDQAARGLLTMDAFANVVRQLVATIAKCQSPSRDAPTQAWLRETTAMLTAPGEGGEGPMVRCVEPVFDGLFGMVADTKRDLLNYQIEMMRAHLTRDGKGIEYQRDVFAKRLASGEITLDRAKAFVGRALALAPAQAGIAPEAVARGEAASCRHLLVFAVVDWVFAGLMEDAPANNADAVGADGSGAPASAGTIAAPPETLDVEGEALANMARGILNMASSATLMLKTNQFAVTVLRRPATTDSEKGELYAFFHDGSSEGTSESVTKVNVPAEGGGTKEMLLVATHDPHGPKGRRARLESAAVFAAGVLGKRGQGPLSSDHVARLQEVFFQLAEHPSKDVVFRAAATILRSACLKCIGKALAARGQLNAADVVQEVVGRGPLGMPEAGVVHFTELMQTLLKLVVRNFQIHQDTYKTLMQAAAVA